MLIVQSGMSAKVGYSSVALSAIIGVPVGADAKLNVVFQQNKVVRIKKWNKRRK